MKKVLPWFPVLILVIVLVLSGCVSKNETSGKAIDEDLQMKATAEAVFSAVNQDTEASPALAEEIKPGIIKTYKQSVPALRFIGKKYSDASGWGEWWENDWFSLIEKAAGGAETVHELYEDGDAYIGLMLVDKTYSMKEYWIGMFVAPGTEVPEGFQSIDYPAQNLGVCWIYGENFDVITSYCGKVAGSLKTEGIEVLKESNGSFWSFERYQCPRYTSPDENGNIIMDYCYFVK